MGFVDPRDYCLNQIEPIRRGYFRWALALLGFPFGENIDPSHKHQGCYTPLKPRADSSLHIEDGQPDPRGDKERLDQRADKSDHFICPSSTQARATFRPK